MSIGDNKNTGYYDRTVSASGLPFFTLDDYYKMISDIDPIKFEIELYDDFGCRNMSFDPVFNWDAFIEDPPARESGTINVKLEHREKSPPDPV
jgi:hypothetical protein